jgi:ferrous iron transport protein A
MTLDELKAGETAVIKRFSGNLELQSRLVEMGLLVGTRLRVVKKAPFGGPVELKVRDYYVTLRREDASQIVLSS